VEEKPNHPPTATVSIERQSILRASAPAHLQRQRPGQRSAHLQLTHDRRTDRGSGSNVQFDAAGLQPGSYGVKCMVNDGRGAPRCFRNVEVKSPRRSATEASWRCTASTSPRHSLRSPSPPRFDGQPGQRHSIPWRVTPRISEVSARRSFWFRRPRRHSRAKDYNVKLSERRVERTKSYLIERAYRRTISRPGVWLWIKT